MMKVYLEGFGEPYAVVGTYVSEDERYMILYDGTIKRRIPHKRIVHIEDLAEAIDEVQPYSPPEETVVADKSPRDRLQEIIQEKIGQRKAAKKNPEQVISDASVRKDVNVIITGATERTLRVSLPEAIISTQRYTPSLMKEIALNTEIKAIMESGVIFDGVPTVSGENIYIRTKNLTETAGSRLGTATRLAGIAQAATMNTFTPPNKVFDTDFSMKSHSPQDFAVTGSPFDGPVPLEAGDEVETQPANDIVVEEEANENTSQEEGTGKAEDHEGVPQL